ncbi:hypothetical protein GN109_15660 [Collimonas pratensis]|uniref:Uncharacterized protein n=1 Tax=Collimonas pratensis TaxID=279113 RepID=A0A127PXG1_9BURK|nr:hypothetical protein [Collimonas pratensis]AMP02429.1 hypothetical protein CPter91_0029 [Collimonas pratensis]NKI70860.1 hypothetical protein [Collimonas pratensis]
MKKLLGVAALLIAFAPFAQAQDSSGVLASHPDARNDRTPVEAAAPAKHVKAKAHHKAVKAKAKAAEAKDAAKEAAPK